MYECESILPVDIAHNVDEFINLAKKLLALR